MSPQPNKCCRNCLWWGGQGSGYWKDLGACNRIKSSDVSDDAALAVLTLADPDATLMTSPKFSCAMFEPRSGRN